MFTNIAYASILFLLLMSGCREDAVESGEQTKAEKKWEEIALFKNLNIMYMLQHKGVLYVSAIIKQNIHADSASMVFTTTDGIQWDTLRIFSDQIGPLAFNGDTLTVFETGQTWKYHHSFGWKIFWDHFMLADQIRDMFYLGNVLYVFGPRYIAYSQDTSRLISAGIGKMSKFIISTSNGSAVAYTRPYYVYKDDISWFDGYEFHSIMNGIPSSENRYSNYPSMAFHADTLFAGFNTPSRIKKYVNGSWSNVTDSIAVPSDAYLFNPPLMNRPSVILFHKNRMFVGTERSGILEWTDSGWVSMSNGLRKQWPEYPTVNIYTSVIFLEAFSGYLFTGYGEPWFAPTDKGRGVYRYKLD